MAHTSCIRQSASARQRSGRGLAIPARTQPARARVVVDAISGWPCMGQPPSPWAETPAAARVPLTHPADLAAARVPLSHMARLTATLRLAQALHLLLLGSEGLFDLQVGLSALVGRSFVWTSPNSLENPIVSGLSAREGERRPIRLITPQRLRSWPSAVAMR